MSDCERKVGRGHAVAERAGHVETDDVGCEEINRLAKHARFGFDSADAPADDAEAVNHGRVRIGADESVGIIDALAFEHAFGKVFEIDLMNDADARRDNFEAVESLRAPFKKLITLTIALELHLHVQTESVGRTGEIDLDGVIDNQINGHERFDYFRILAQVGRGGTHGGQVDQQRHTGKILQNDAGDDERDLLCARAFWGPIRQSPDVRFADLFSVAVAEDRFEHDAD